MGKISYSFYKLLEIRYKLVFGLQESNPRPKNCCWEYYLGYFHFTPFSRLKGIYARNRDRQNEQSAWIVLCWLFAKTIFKPSICSRSKYVSKNRYSPLLDKNAENNHRNKSILDIEMAQLLLINHKQQSVSVKYKRDVVEALLSFL